MFGLFRHFLPARKVVDTRPSVPPGTRVYAIGDIHGRLDLLTALVAAIDADSRRRNESTHGKAPVTTIVLLGDLIDRGADSAGVLAFVRDWQRQADVRILIGNHEEMLLASFHDFDALHRLLKFGGRATLASFGIPTPPVDDSIDLAKIQARMKKAFPADTLAFIRSFQEMVRIGDYAFVHAGIRPGRPLDQQNPDDTRWIREPFLSSEQDHGAIIVHGHTIVSEADITPSRIGIDTGAYASGRLTALGLEGPSRWLIQTRKNGDIVATDIET